LCSEVDEGCRREASSSGMALPASFSVGRAFQALVEQERSRESFPRAAAALRDSGFRTRILASPRPEDGAGRLRREFPAGLEFCRLGKHQPEPGIYSHAPRARPHQLLSREEPIPTPCDPSGVAHGYVRIRPGVQLHFVELGQGPPVLLCHGFPESWRSWRFQIPALADAGFRVIALEMKGYGESTAPPDIPEYSQEQICKDLVVFLDKLGIARVVLVGHDWGGAVAWNMALTHPERV
ncbi:bifunctional epoxide hydrolase 2-like, partial [Myiozetetes cayanensis]|uniref:bifunctional epoxide hydrolase 2-like n=1 Tax=Myiozetetes cayanensis TaxID=478635 RepID=UPI00215FD1CE